MRGYKRFQRPAFAFYSLVIVALYWTLQNGILAAVAAPLTEDADVELRRDPPHHILPENSHIPHNVLEHLVATNLKRMVKQLNIPSTAVLKNGKTVVKQCERAEDFHHVPRRHGCYIGAFVCDKRFVGRCFWSFRRQCECPRLWILKTYECRIGTITVPLPDSEYQYMDVPVGDCRIAVWIWVITIASSLPLLWVLVFRGVRVAFRTIY